MSKTITRPPVTNMKYYTVYLLIPDILYREKITSKVKNITGLKSFEM